MWTNLSRVLYVEVPRPIVWLYVVALGAVFVFVSVHTPLTLYPGAPHDDGLYMSLGRHLSEGSWLGPYNEYTLAKGPGYPAFLAVSNWLGIPASLAQALFQCLAAVFFVFVCHRFVKSTLLSGLMLALLLWQPLPLMVYLRRILREQIYSAELLVVLGLLILVLFAGYENRRRYLYAAACGLALGWFWLTREEGYWVVPAIALLCGAAVFQAYRFRQFRRIAAALSIVLITFVATQIGFRTINWRVYGSFVGVDIKEANFQKALGALQSVRSGGTKPFIPITRAARQHVYAASPAFASLKLYFDPVNEAPATPTTPGWVGFTCALLPEACGEIAAGWFLWGLRDAAAQRGHYATPARASAFFGQIAYEVSTACARGALECRAQPIAELPPVSFADIGDRLPSRLRRSFDMITMKYSALQINESLGSEELLAAASRFLNYPLYLLPSDNKETSRYSVNGWYHRSGSDWFSVTAKRQNSESAGIDVIRVASPDLARALNDPMAVNQRFALRFRCNDECVLTFDAASAPQIETSLSELRRKGLTAFKSGAASLIVESVEHRPDPLAIRTASETLANRIRTAAVTHYHLLLLPALAVGAIAFVAASLLYWRRALLSFTYVLALGLWGLTFTRAFLLSFIDATAFPALEVAYLSPAYFMAAAAPVVSIAAFLQLSGVSAASVRSQS